MVDEIGEKKVCIKKIYNCIFSIFILKILLHSWHVEWYLKLVGFLRDKTEDNKNNEYSGRKKKMVRRKRKWIWMYHLWG